MKVNSTLLPFCGILQKRNDGGRTLGNLNIGFLSQDRVWESLPSVSHPKHTCYSKCTNNNFHYQSLTPENNDNLSLI